MQANVVLRLVSAALQDLEPGLERRWPWEGGDDERIGLLDFLNDALRAVALQRPDAFAVTESILLESGMRQRLPCRRVHAASKDATRLIGLTRNMGSNGETPGAGIMPVDMQVLLAWANPVRIGNIVENYAYERMANAMIYCVYPAVPDRGEVWVEATYAAAPEVIVSPDQPLGLADDYAATLKHHVLASVFAGDNEMSNTAKAQMHMQLFSSMLGAKTMADSAV